MPSAPGLVSIGGRARLSGRQGGERSCDDLYAFFVCYHHLAEWIAKDATLSDGIRADVWNFTKSSSAVGLAADVANGFKHLKRDSKRKPRVDPTVRVSAVGGFHVGRPEPAPSGIVVAGGRIWEDGHVLADRCIAEWEDFLRRHDLK